MAEEAVLTEADDGVLLITLNRPDARNAVNAALAAGVARRARRARRRRRPAGRRSSPAPAGLLRRAWT